MTSDLGRRLGVAAVGIPLCVAVVYLGGLAFALGLALLASGAMWEYARMFRRLGARVFVGLGLTGAAAFPLIAWLTDPITAWGLTSVYLLVVSGYAMVRVTPSERPIAATALTVFGVLYLGGLLAFGVPLRETFTGGRLSGTLLFFLPVVVTWISDTAAYLGGGAWGRHALAPHISPNKTVEGALFALAAGPLTGLVYGSLLLTEPVRLGPGQGLLLGLLVATAAVLGDLVESVLKRECEVKDSSGLLPGHGGLLDRLDSLLWAFPVAWLFLKLTIGEA